MDTPVEPWIIEELKNKFEDFRHAYEPDGLGLYEFDTFGPTVRTLRQFIGGYERLVSSIRDLMLPNPDI